MQLPLLLVFNKTDVVDHQFALEWMKDSDAFKDALDAESSYAAQLSRSLSLVSWATCSCVTRRVLNV